jgi:hypothetical protein
MKKSKGFNKQSSKSTFNAETLCNHRVIYLRGENTAAAFGSTLAEAIECFGGLGALDEEVFDTQSDKKAFKDLFNRSAENITFGDEDFGYQIIRGIALMKYLHEEMLENFVIDFGNLSIEGSSKESTKRLVDQFSYEVKDLLLKRHEFVQC